MRFHVESTVDVGIKSVGFGPTRHYVAGLRVPGRLYRWLSEAWPGKRTFG